MSWSNPLLIPWNKPPRNIRDGEDPEKLDQAVGRIRDLGDAGIDVLVEMMTSRE